MLWEILVPTKTNEGKEIPIHEHHDWDIKVRTIAGGLTIASPVKGQWTDKDGILFIERMLPIRIACPRQQIEQIADLTASHYKQKAIMYYLVSEEVYIKSY